MQPSQSMNEDELLKAIKPLLTSEAWPYFKELIKRKQSSQLKLIASLVEPVEIYRAQGRIHAYDALLTITA